MKGIFIALEGPDGSGKSTIMKRIVKYFQDRDIEFVGTREPGGTQISESIREIILSEDNVNMVAETEALLYAASRSQHIHEKILPALREGKVVICERFILSSLAYQGIGRNLGVEEVAAINDFAIKGIRPDLTLFFDVDPKLTLLRKTGGKKGDRLEEEGIEFHEKVFHGYKKILQESDDKLKIIDASQDIDKVFEQCIYYIGEALKEEV